LAAPLPSVGLIAFQAAGVGLHEYAALQKQQAGFVRGHPHNKSFRIVEGSRRNIAFRVAM
jgi:hypothetical protein